ncbi:MAG: ATP-binding protein [Pyrinomonadaceae bacterium]|nr:ATP-binding protein [Pyrinomonadaceae bacterium]
MRFFNTFRGKLLIILAFMLIATLSFQYYLNLGTQEENNQILEAQSKALAAGITLGFNSITSSEYLQDLVKREGQPFYDEKTTERIRDIIIINNNWDVTDNLTGEYLPSTGSDGEIKYLKLSELQNLPPLMEGKRLGEDLEKFPNRKTAANKETNGEAYAIPITTSQGRWYAMVILENDKKAAASRAARPLIYTLGILLVSTLITFWLVWRFTRPIANLSYAARQIANGDLCVRVEGANRSDEMGELASQFNRMTDELAKNRELEAKFQEAEKSAVVGRLASAIAHEIRNPLNYINLSLDHLRNKFKPEDETKRETFEKLTAQLKAEVGRINNQITDFLNYSRPAKADLQPTDARKVVEDSLRIVEAQAAECDIKISLIEEENVPKMLADAEFLRSVFNNLFINAVHSMEAKGGHLNVKISPDGQFVKIEIRDTGNGIPPENLEKIFEPYFSTKETGTGLGLAIVQKIIDVHNGEISVESELNEGTVFVVKLPKV